MGTDQKARVNNLMNIHPALKRQHTASGKIDTLDNHRPTGLGIQSAGFHLQLPNRDLCLLWTCTSKQQLRFDIRTASDGLSFQANLQTDELLAQVTWTAVPADVTSDQEEEIEK